MRHIRLANPVDQSAVEAIVQSAYAVYIPRMGRKPLPMLDDYAVRIAARRVLVLEEDGKILGLVVLLPEAETMLLDNIAVSPAIKGRGYGRILLDFAEQAAREAGYDVIRLFTHETMVENIALYMRIGYVETGREGATGLGRVDMSKRLT